MATYGFTTGADTISASGTDTIIATAATLGAGDHLSVSGYDTTIQVQGGGALDFTSVLTVAPNGFTTVVLDDTATSLTFGTQDVSIYAGAGADTIDAAGGALFYSDQADVVGDHLGMVAGILALGTIDLTQLGSYGGASVLSITPMGNVTIDQSIYDNTGFIIKTNTNGGTLTLAGDNFDFHFSRMSSPFPAAGVDLVTTSQSGIDMKMSQQGLAYFHSVTGLGAHDVIEVTGTDVLTYTTFTGIEEVKFQQALYVDQVRADAIHGFTGNGVNSQLYFIDYNVDLSGNQLTGITAIRADGNVTGSAGNDTITTYYSLNDTIHGGAGNDRIESQAGTDQIYGDAGNDTLVGGAGADTLTGGADADRFLGTAADLNGDRITDFAAEDRIVISNYSAATTTVSYAGGVLTIDGDGAGAGAPITMTLDGTYNGSFSVYDSGSGAGVQFTPTPVPTAPTSGSDTLAGAAGADTIDGLAGNDSIAGLGGNDSLSGSAGNDTIDGGEGNDTVMGLNDNDSLFGGNGDDLVRGGNGTDYVDGGAGNDAIWGDPGNDTLVGGAGADRFFFISAYGNDRILDFNYDEGDRIRLDKALTISSTLDNGAGDAVVTTSDGSTLTLVGHHASEVQAGWFGL